MQHGCMERLNRKRGPEVWQFRWSVTGPEGKRHYHKTIELCQLLKLLSSASKNRLFSKSSLAGLKRDTVCLLSRCSLDPVRAICHLPRLAVKASSNCCPPALALRSFGPR
jgi:hypothetical protein